MTLTPLRFKPGINREITPFANGVISRLMPGLNLSGVRVI